VLTTPVLATGASSASSLSPWPSPLYRRVGSYDFTFEACSSFTRVTACQIACPPKVDFVTRLQSGRLTLPNCSSATEPCRWLLGWVLLPLVICPSGHAIELRRACCRWRVTVLALSIARWVHISTMATFPEAPPISRSRSDAVSLRFSLPVAPRFIWGWDRARTRLL
jgi:hypothetical protein